MPVSARRPLRLAAAPLALLLLAGCAGVTPIGELLGNSGRYDGETVSIRGEVTGGAGALGVGGYQVRDDTGTLTVISEVGGAPPTGSRVKVRGVFQALLTLGERSVAVLRERERDVD